MKRITRGRYLIGSGGGAYVDQGSFTHVAGTSAAGAETSYTHASTGALPGDFVQASSNATPGSASVTGSVPVAGTVAVTVKGGVGGTATWSAGTVFYRVERPTS